MRVIFALLLLAIVAPATGAEQGNYVPPDGQLWRVLNRQIHELPMSEDVHIAIHRLMDSIEREAQMRAVKAKVKAQAVKEPSTPGSP